MHRNDWSAMRQRAVNSHTAKRDGSLVGTSAGSEHFSL